MTTPPADPPNSQPVCPACADPARPLHRPADWAFHPYAGHGYDPARGWTHPDLENHAKAPER